MIISDKDAELAKKCFLFLKHQIQQYTNETDSPIWVPYNDILGEIFPADRGQDNRAFNRFCTLVNIIALTKAHLRYKLLAGDEELVIASLEDLREALHVIQNVTGLPPHKLRFYNEYVLPLFRNKGERLETREICEFYSANNPKNSQMNANNLRKNYLQELVNHNYLEQEQSEDTKVPKYLYTPLADFEEHDEDDDDTAEDSKENNWLPLIL